MLYVQIFLDDYRYILSASNIVELVPGVKLTPVPGVPSYVAGLCNYRGLSVPVIDLCALFIDRPSARKLSTRIIFVNSDSANRKNKIIGLLVEKATETVKVDEGSFIDSGIQNDDMPFIGPVISDGQGLVTRILTEEIFSRIDNELLFGAA